MKSLFLYILLVMPLFAYTQDTIPQVFFRDSLCETHRFFIDTVNKNTNKETRNKIFFLTKEGLWEELILYDICPTCSIVIHTCRYTPKERLEICATIVFTTECLTFVYKTDTWHRIKVLK
jgi:hypothetical protein